MVSSKRSAANVSDRSAKRHPIVPIEDVSNFPGVEGDTTPLTRRPYEDLPAWARPGTEVDTLKSDVGEETELLALEALRSPFSAW